MTRLSHLDDDRGDVSGVARASRLPALLLAALLPLAGCATGGAPTATGAAAQPERAATAETPAPGAQGAAIAGQVPPPPPRVASRSVNGRTVQDESGTPVGPDAPSELDVRESRVHHSQGIGYMRDGHIALAIREFRAAVDLNPYDEWLQLALGEAYRQRGFLDDAETHVVNALRLKPDFQDARLTLTGIYIQQERFAEAISQSQLLIDDPTYPQPWAALTNQGYAYMLSQQPAKARKALQQAIDYEPDYWRAYLNLGILEADQGHKMEALANFEKVIGLRPGGLSNAEANYRMAEIYISLGNREQAMRHLVAVSSTTPNGPWGKRSEEYLNRLR